MKAPPQLLPISLSMLPLSGAALGDDAAMLKCRALADGAARLACHDAIDVAARPQPAPVAAAAAEAAGSRAALEGTNNSAKVRRVQ